MFVKQLNRSTLDAYKAQMAHTLHAQNPRYPQYLSKPLGPWATKIKGLWPKHVFYIFVEFLIIANPIGATPIRVPPSIGTPGDGDLLEPGARESEAERGKCAPPHPLRPSPEASKDSSRRSPRTLVGALLFMEDLSYTNTTRKRAHSYLKII